MPAQEPSFEAYAAARAAALVRTAYLLCGDRRLAEDLAQETLIRVFRHWSRVRGSDQPDAYVRRILVNEHLRWRRRSAVETARTRTVAAVPDVLVPGADRSVREDAVWAALATLPRRQRAVLVLRYAEDWSDGDIARALRCSPATIRSLASRALRRLRLDPAIGPPLRPRETA